MEKLSILLVVLLLGTVADAQSPKKGQSLDNLQQAYQAEANASRRYVLFSKKATQEKQEQIAKLFRAVSASESVHM